VTILQGDGSVSLLNIVWTKAAECALAISATSDSSIHKTLIQMQSVWIALADAGLGLDDHKLVAGIERIHTEILEDHLPKFRSARCELGVGGRRQ